VKKLRALIVPAVCVVATLFLFRIFFLIGYVPTESMEPTLEKGSYILGLRTYGELKNGDIIVFEHSGRLLVKRIAASSGDTIEKDGMHITVPEDSYYVLGDNVENSYDSRYWKEPFVQKDCIVAKLLFCA
jgi:signal peptidase I